MGQIDVYLCLKLLNVFYENESLFFIFLKMNLNKFVIEYQIIVDL